jgi:predicted DNA-binding transcriptional regulator AlpA
MAAAVPIPIARKSRDKFTVAEVCDDLQIAQSTFYEWRTKGTGPRCLKSAAVSSPASTAATWHQSPIGAPMFVKR